jgi:PAS domain S-box-containing protein
MNLQETAQIDLTQRHFSRFAEASAQARIPVSGIAGEKLLIEERAELLDVDAWAPMLEMFSRTMKVAVALTDVEGNLLGTCHNAQPTWTFIHGATGGERPGCPFCLSPDSPCTAVADALRTGVPTIVRDQAGLAHVAIPLSLDNQPLGAIIAGQVADQYPESLSLERAAKKFGVSAQELWKLSSKQRPVSRSALQLAGDLLWTLGQAFLRQRYSFILETHVARTNLQFRLLVEGVTDHALFTIDYLGRVTSWNVGAERILGYPEDRIIGKQFSCMFTAEDMQIGAPEGQLLKALQSGRSEDEGWRVRENRTQFWANVIITPLAEEGHSRQGFALVVQDVTDRRRTAIELEITRNERMSLQEQFLSHVSHELRTPLTAIYFFTTNLLEGVVGDVTAAQRQHLEFTLENVKQLKDMVSDLLDVSRIETLKLTVDPQYTAVPSLISEVVRTCCGNARLKNISLLTDSTQSVPAAWADRARVRQILINLIDNAIGFTPYGGTITVGVQTLREESGFLHLTVTDTGCGISPENCLTVFDRLAQVKSVADTSRKGLGLGLFIAKELVSRQGGRIWVESQVGRGSTFHFTIPVFSLGKWCEWIFTPANLAAHCLTVLSIDAPTADELTPPQDQDGIRNVLERCIVANQDLLLPPMTEGSTPETCFVLVCTETCGAETTTTTARVRRALDISELHATISVTQLQLSATEERWGKRIAEVTARIDELVQAHLLERRGSNEGKENFDCR